jgi:uncharacterized MAPEG superfamily protein
MMEMTFAFWCVPIAMLLPLVWVGIAKANARGYDNSRPRVWLEGLDGLAQRANWAQKNSFEAFPAFAAAVIIAHLTGTAQMTIDILAGVFILARIAHGIFYLLDKPNLRSLVWVFGFGSTFALFVA